MMDRRAFLRSVAGGVIAAPLAVEAQQARKVPRIGVLAPGTPTPGNLPLQVFDAFRQGLRDLGYVEGKTVVLETRWDEFRPEQIASLIRDLLQRNVDVILAGTTATSVAVKQATSTMPIVMAATGGDPVALGLAASLGRPGGEDVRTTAEAARAAERSDSTRQPRRAFLELQAAWPDRGEGP
jgi:putative ABC transport system substrate-binding protein